MSEPNWMVELRGLQDAGLITGREAVLRAGQIDPNPTKWKRGHNWHGWAVIHPGATAPYGLPAFKTFARTRRDVIDIVEAHTGRSWKSLYRKYGLRIHRVKLVVVG